MNTYLRLWNLQNIILNTHYMKLILIAFSFHFHTCRVSALYSISEGEVILSESAYMWRFCHNLEMYWQAVSSNWKGNEGESGLTVE
jgi:hypothetical protein